VQINVVLSGSELCRQEIATALRPRNDRPKPAV